MRPQSLRPLYAAAGSGAALFAAIAWTGREYSSLTRYWRHGRQLLRPALTVDTALIAAAGCWTAWQLNPLEPSMRHWRAALALQHRCRGAVFWQGRCTLWLVCAKRAAAWHLVVHRQVRSNSVSPAGIVLEHRLLARCAVLRISVRAISS